MNASVRRVLDGATSRPGAGSCASPRQRRLDPFSAMLVVVVRRALAMLSLVAMSALPSTAWIAYEEARFEAALTRGDGFVLALVTDWCTTCSRQEMVVTELLTEPRFAGLTVLVADFDREHALRKRLKVSMQGTFIVFNRGSEVARSTGLIDRDAIAAMLARAR